MTLLARFAEATFWMARYMERAENLARLIDVNESFARDSRGTNDWAGLLFLNGDLERFDERHDRRSAANVLNFYLADGGNATSIPYSIRAARENARTLRPLISTEMWSQLNAFYNRLLSLSPADLAVQHVSRLCTEIKEACQTHTGIVEGTFFRDEGHCFYLMGKAIERADQTSRLLDIKYHTLLPSPGDVGSPLDVSQWNTLLRSASAYHAFRRTHARGMSAPAVAGFLVFHDSFPRSILLCLKTAADMLERLRRRHGVTRGQGARDKLGAIIAGLEATDIDTVIASGMHEFLDRTQADLIDFTQVLGTELFGHAFQTQSAA